MHEAYSYVTVAGGRTAAARTAEALAAAGATVVATWAGGPGIGWWDDELVVLAGWPGDAPADAPGELLRATARPTAIAPFEPGGLWAHRWFETAADTWAEFLDLSTGAWPAFEREYGATIHGFFRAEAVEPPDARVLLVTRYPSLASWESSRGAGRSEDTDVAEAGRRFLRRRELTRRTIVRTAILV